MSAKSDRTVEAMIARLKHENDIAEIHRMLEWIQDRFPTRYRTKRPARHNARSAR